MEYYFLKMKSDKNFRGKERTTLPTTLARDLNRLQKQEMGDHTYCRQLKLRNNQDLEELRELAQNRDNWIQLTQKILKAAEAEVAIVTSAERLYVK